MTRWVMMIVCTSLFTACAVEMSEPDDASDDASDDSGDGDPTGLGQARPDRFTSTGPSVWLPSLPGSSCAVHADCDSAPDAGDGFCYRGEMGALTFPDEGYCTIDDGTGAVCAVDTDCPGSSQCIDIDGYRLCLPACVMGACPAGQACLDAFGGLPISEPSCLPGNGSAADGSACVGFYDCNASSTCWTGIEYPGGMCAAYGCTVGTSTGCNGGTCIAYVEGLSSGAVCVATCTVDSDCRDGEGYVCHDPDGPGPEVAYCRHPHVGDPCTSDAACGAGWTCQEGAGYPGGYCTMTGCPTPGTIGGCSSGSVCADVSGTNMCVDRCADIGVESTCRSGYTCTDVGAGVGGGCL